MMGRRILVGDITSPNVAGELRMSEMADFPMGPSRKMRSAPRELLPAFPCVIDVNRARTLYVAGLDAQRLREAPFCGVFAREEAKTVFLVPWEAGSINRPRATKDPIYLFSPGRCGSTLLHNIFVEAKINSISEPDIASALLSPSYAKYAAMRPLLHWVTRNFVRDMVSAVGSETTGLVAKLRSQFCIAAPALMNGSRERRTIFMTRRFEDWAPSVGRLFRVTPNYLVREYANALACCAYLLEHSDCHVLHYEDLLIRPHDAASALGSFLRQDISREAVDKAMSVAAHEGTRIERVTEQGRARWDSIRDDTFRLWKESGTVELAKQVLGR